MSYTRGYSPEALIRSLYARKATLDDDMNDIALQGAEAIKDLSVAYSPVDEGHVEDAHRVVIRSTRRGAPAYDVIVDEGEADIHLYIHELNSGFMHGREYDLGPLSEEKAAATGMPVGPKFLERAFDELRPEIIKDYQRIVKKFVRN